MEIAGRHGRRWEKRLRREGRETKDEERREYPARGRVPEGVGPEHRIHREEHGQTLT